MTIDEITTKPYRVLSLDGGGMRGLYTASLLNTLSDRFGNQLDVGKGFDLIVGTSTGSILAAGLVAGIPLPQIINLYRENGAKIFGSPIPNNICLKFIWGLLHSCRPANGNELLERILREVFNDETRPWGAMEQPTDLRLFCCS